MLINKAWSGEEGEDGEVDDPVVVLGKNEAIWGGRPGGNSPNGLNGGWFDEDDDVGGKNRLDGVGSGGLDAGGLLLLVLLVVVVVVDGDGDETEDAAAKRAAML